MTGAGSKHGETAACTKSVSAGSWDAELLPSFLMLKGFSKIL